VTLSISLGAFSRVTLSTYSAMSNKNAIVPVSSIFWNRRRLSDYAVILSESQDLDSFFKQYTLYDVMCVTIKYYTMSIILHPHMYVERRGCYEMMLRDDIRLMPSTT
jgi:hypothetical protein